MILQDWVANLAADEKERPQCLTVRRLAERFEASGSTKALRTKVGPESNPERLVNDMLDLVYEKERGLFDNLSLIPSQRGQFRIRAILNKDVDIDDDLKNISELLGESLRDQLASRAIPTEVQDLLGESKFEDLIPGLLTKLRTLAASPTEKYAKANVAFLSWLVQRSRFDLIEDFPALTMAHGPRTEKVSSKLSSSRPLLAPPDQWLEPFKGYESLFPSDSILSKDYTPAISADGWNSLDKQGLVLLSPLLQVTTELDREKLETLLAEGYLDQQDHRVAAQMTTLAFLQEEGGVMDLVRDSQERATKFLEFLIKVLVAADVSWNNSVECGCECESSHKVYPSLWLFAIRTRRWVPFPAKERHPAEAESLARLFEARPDLQGKLMEDLISMFLNRLKISITDLLKQIGKPSEQAKLEIEKALAGVFLATGKSVEQLNALAAIWRDPDYRSQIAKLVTARELVQSNQRIGDMVEQLIKEIFAQSGITLSKIHRGGDYVYENDFLDSEGQVVLKAEKYTIEVKATTSDSVRLTPAQAEESVAQDPNYFVCIVQLPNNNVDIETVRKNARVVSRIGLELRPLVEAFHNVESDIASAVSHRGDVNVVIEGTQVRFQINEKVWTASPGLDSLKHLFAEGDASKTSEVVVAPS